eukprot:Amastigsp_a676780_96.p4 type:complete len:163 gc:universal Amastigsp_a676780_96:238-726(+)
MYTPPPSSSLAGLALAAPAADLWNWCSVSWTSGPMVLRTYSTARSFANDWKNFVAAEFCRNRVSGESVAATSISTSCLIRAIDAPSRDSVYAIVATTRSESARLGAVSASPARRRASRGFAATNSSMTGYDLADASVYRGDIQSGKSRSHASSDTGLPMSTA